MFVEQVGLVPGTSVGRGGTLGLGSVDVNNSASCFGPALKEFQSTPLDRRFPHRHMLGIAYARVSVHFSR